MASACGMVRGNRRTGSRFLQSSCCRRSLTRPMMMSSGTRPPASMTFLASRPSGVPALTWRAQHVAGGDLRDAELFADELRLRALAGARSARRMSPTSENSIESERPSANAVLALFFWRTCACAEHSKSTCKSAFGQTVWHNSARIAAYRPHLPAYAHRDRQLTEMIRYPITMPQRPQLLGAPRTAPAEKASMPHTLSRKSGRGRHRARRGGKAGKPDGRSHRPPHGRSDPGHKGIGARENRVRHHSRGRRP